MKPMAMWAAKAYFENRGYDVLDVDHDNMMIVTKDSPTELVFIEVACVEMDDFPKGSDRDRFERYVINYRLPHDFFGRIRFDKCSMIIRDRDRALIRHHINCFE